MEQKISKYHNIKQVLYRYRFQLDFFSPMRSHVTRRNAELWRPSAVRTAVAKICDFKLGPIFAGHQDVCCNRMAIFRHFGALIYVLALVKINLQS